MISDRNIEEGIAEFFIPGRLECVSREPLVILDAGHNEGALRELSKSIKLYAENKRIIALCAFMKDKDSEAATELIAPLCYRMIFTNVDTVRGEDPDVLCGYAAKLCKNAVAVYNADEAFSLAVSDAAEDDIVLVCGSFYLVSDIRKKYIEG